MIHTFENILDYSKLSRLIEIVVRKEIEIKNLEDLKIINSPDFRGIKIVFDKLVVFDDDLNIDTIIIAKSARSRGNFQATLFFKDKPEWHLTLSPSLEPKTDSFNRKFDTVFDLYNEFWEALEKEKYTAYIVKDE
jgi:hypothetical protein